MFHLSKKIMAPFNEVIEKVTVELKKEGFGIITTVDLQEIFKKRINTDFRNYIILGACNPQYAYNALLLNDKAGVYLPCNVVVQQYDNGAVEVSIINPSEQMQSMNDPQLGTLAAEVTDAMKNVLNRL